MIGWLILIAWSGADVFGRQFARVQIHGVVLTLAAVGSDLVAGDALGGLEPGIGPMSSLASGTRRNPQNVPPVPPQQENGHDEDAKDRDDGDKREGTGRTQEFFARRRWLLDGEKQGGRDRHLQRRVEVHRRRRRG